MFKKIKKYMYDRRLRKNIAKANNLAKLTGYRYFVIKLRGKMRVVRKQNLKVLIRKNKFKAGVTIQDIENRALYVTPLCKVYSNFNS